MQWPSFEARREVTKMVFYAEGPLLKNMSQSFYFSLWRPRFYWWMGSGFFGRVGPQDEKHHQQIRAAQWGWHYKTSQQHRDTVARAFALMTTLQFKNKSDLSVKPYHSYFGENISSFLWGFGVK